jgi:hypothetical protein
VEANRESPIDAAELQRIDVTGYLMAVGSESELQNRLDGLMRFLNWLGTEQECAIGDLAAQLQGELGSFLKVAVIANAELAEGAVRADATAVLVITKPPTVEAEDGQAVEVEGLPESALERCRVGDRVMGHWAAGHFRAAAWVPEELLPPVPAAPHQA